MIRMILFPLVSVAADQAEPDASIHLPDQPHRSQVVSVIFEGRGGSCVPLQGRCTKLGKLLILHLNTYYCHVCNL